MTDLSEIKKYVEESFNIDSESAKTANVLLLRVPGFDSHSLAKYIIEKFTDIECRTQFIEPHKFSDKDWIKIEQDYKGYRLTV